jgi:PBSX family phage terminase large subunit
MGKEFMTQLVHRYEARGALLDVFRSRERQVLVSGPAGTGKSRAILEKLNICAKKYPRMKGLILRKTHKSLAGSIVQEFVDEVIKEELATGSIKFVGHTNLKPAQFRYSNGSSISLGGLDNPTKFMSTQWDVAYINEAIEIRLEDWEKINIRLRNGKMPYHQLIADTNPDAPTHWLISRVREGKIKMIESRHTDNPRYYIDETKMTDEGAEYLAALQDNTELMVQRYFYGKWVAAEGIIYDQFDPAIHVRDRFEIPTEWRRYWAIDFGYNNPFVCQWWAEDPDGNLYLYREIYKSKRLVQDHANDIKQIMCPHDIWIEPKPSKILTDHDPDGRGQLERVLGLGTTAAHKVVSEGIQAVQARVTRSNPRLFLLRDSILGPDKSLAKVHKPTCTEEEITGYIWDSSTDKPREQPLKANDHGMDAMRYMVAYKDLAPKARVRFVGGPND